MFCIKDLQKTKKFTRRRDIENFIIIYRIKKKKREKFSCSALAADFGRSMSVVKKKEESIIKNEMNEMIMNAEKIEESLLKGP